MIKRLIAFLFAREVKHAKEDALKEVRALIEDAKIANRKQYVSYEKFGTDEPRFLQGMQPLFDNRFIISWLNGQKQNCLDLMIRAMAQGMNDKVIQGMAQVMMIESLFRDLEQFKQAHDEYLEDEQRNRGLVFEGDKVQ
jgi:hypothetical protein